MTVPGIGKFSKKEYLCNETKPAILPDISGAWQKVAAITLNFLWRISKAIPL